jgi:hypothetical protein
MFASHLALSTFWEEATELIFILAIFYLLWVFRRTLRLPKIKL